MLTLKNSKHIRTCRNINSFRSGKHSTAMSMAHLDRAQIATEQERLISREARRLRLAEQWREHYEHVSRATAGASALRAHEK